MQWFLNFQPCQQISISDRGLAYGDGLFETIATQAGVVSHLEFHQSRLRRGFKRLNFSIAAEQVKELWAFVETQALRYPNCGIKLMVTRGEGGRGYLPPESPSYQFLVGVFDAPDYAKLKEIGVELALSPIPCATSKAVSGLKHLNRLENVLAKQALPTDCYEGVMLDDKGLVIEAIQSNVFWLKNGVLYTPALTHSGVQGGCRNRVIHFFQGAVNIANLSLASLSEADEIFVTNALSGIIPVVKFQGRDFSIGRYTKQLMDHIN